MHLAPSTMAATHAITHCLQQQAHVKVCRTVRKTHPSPHQA